MTSKAGHIAWAAEAVAAYQGSSQNLPEKARSAERFKSPKAWCLCPEMEPSPDSS